MTASRVERKFILLHEKDNTVTALVDLHRGEVIAVDSGSEKKPITLRQDIAYAHKFAREYIPKGADVIKYGEVIGIATSDIHPGDHVHVHNVDSKRVRSGPS
ncbi:MAG: UxaA family hydrolase [Deltaproteobacteria bacterium]|nr:UxaA family hydrolase [Deltaproteobacteria bacterium]MBW1960703.1 UxaA family hydrolase [Deltaproteobacteria bacterium]MBW1993586.1 UxaA family hydrolase [Deltaproteobacteria bacterium]MBW2151968.1 UxaA family hydrolase [Deltaproteobacteria bacterium]